MEIVSVNFEGNFNFLKIFTVKILQILCGDGIHHSEQIYINDSR